MTNLKKYDIAYIGIRLLAIYIALQVITSLPTWIMTLSMIFGRTDVSYPLLLKIFGVFLPLLSLLIPILLWCWSNKIAKLITNPSSEIAKTSAKQVDDIQAMLFCTIGVFVLVTTLPNFFAFLYAYVRIYMQSVSSGFVFQQAPSISTFIVYLLKILFSIILMFNAKQLSAFFHKLRYAGK